MGEIVFSVLLLCCHIYFFMSGDLEIGKKVKILEKGEFDSGQFLSLQVNKELSHRFLQS